PGLQAAEARARRRARALTTPPLVGQRQPRRRGRRSSPSLPLPRGGSARAFEAPPRLPPLRRQGRAGEGLPGHRRSLADAAPDPTAPPPSLPPAFAGGGAKSKDNVMDFSRFFIDRPIFAAVLSIVIFAAGLISIPLLPIGEYPEVV